MTQGTSHGPMVRFLTLHDDKHTHYLYNHLDASKFGAAYLAKMGWSSGTGLGVEGEGRTTHIKVNQKLDMLGIGHAHQNSANGIAWKQNNDFENLLRRLNGGDEGTASGSSTKVEGFTKAVAESGKDDSEESGKESKKRKRVDESPVEGAGEVEESKADKKKKKKDKKKKGKDVEDSESKEPSEKVDHDEQSPAPSSKPTPTPPVARP